MSPISATMISAVSGPMPGSAVRALTRGCAFASSASEASSRSTTACSASMTSSRSATAWRALSGRGSASSHARPAPFQQLAPRSQP
jgi:hypothetical protein